MSLLGGRAITRWLAPLVSAELGDRFDLRRALECGHLPTVVLDPGREAYTLAAYVHTHIREEIREEGLVREIDPFLRFLQLAGSMNGQELKVENIARDAAPRTTVDGYLAILADTVLGHLLPAYRPGVKDDVDDLPVEPFLAALHAGDIF